MTAALTFINSFICFFSIRVWSSRCSWAFNLTVLTLETLSKDFDVLRTKQAFYVRGVHFNDDISNSPLSFLAKPVQRDLPIELSNGLWLFLSITR